MCPRPQQPLPPASFCHEESGPGGPVGTFRPPAAQNPPGSCWDSDELTEGGGRSTEHSLPEPHPPRPKAALHRAHPLRTRPGLGGSVCGIRRPQDKSQHRVLGNQPRQQSKWEMLGSPWKVECPLSSPEQQQQHMITLITVSKTCGHSVGARSCPEPVTRLSSGNSYGHSVRWGP